MAEKTEIELKEAYDIAAKDFLLSRTKGVDRSGWANREVEQPAMYNLVSGIKGKKILDLGCGPGIHLKEYISQGAIGYGMDISPEMIKLAEKHCLEGQFKVGTVTEIPFDEQFDVITASYVLDHVEDLNKLVIEVNRLLKKGGEFIFSVPHPVYNMFRERNDFKPTNSYFDHEVIYVDIVGKGKSFADYPRTIQDYMVPFLKDFRLVDFIENKPDKTWAEKYKTFNLSYLKMPVLCFFKWRKE